MRQAILQSLKNIEFSETDRPVIKDNEVLMKTSYIGICGSDIHAYHGKHPYISFPIRPGHEMSGEVLEVGKDVTNVKVGDMITVMPQEICHECEPCKSGRYNICEKLKVLGCQSPGAACDYFNVDSALVLKIPEDMSAELAATLEPTAVGIHAVRRAGSVKGKNVVVLGAGTIGNLTAQSALAEGAKSVLISDLSDYRLELARNCGIPHTVNTGKESLKEAIDKAFQGEGADVFLECVGIAPTVNQAIENSPKGKQIVIVGVFADFANVNMGLVQDKELDLLGALMYLKEDFESALEYVRNESIKVRPLISKTFSFEEYGEAFEYIEKNTDSCIKVLIKF